MMHTGLPSSFDAFLAPLSAPEFFARYWEQGHVRVRREDRAHYQGLFSIAEIDQYLALARHNPAATLSLIRVGQPVQQVRADGIEPRRVFEALHAGGTLLLERVDSIWPPLARLAEMLRRALSAHIQINVYVSPEGSQGAHLHPDINDVYVAQLEGAKRWWLYEPRVYEPIENLTHSRYLGDSDTKRMYEREDVQMTLAEETTLEPGDLLYMPRGVVHKAAAVEGSPSLHLAIIAAPVYWVHVLKAAVEVAAAEHSELSRALPPGFETADTSALAAALGDKLQHALALLGQPHVFERAIEILQRERLSHAAHAGDGHVEQIMRVGELAPGMWVERRDGQHCAVTISGDVATIRFGGGEMNGPARIRPALEFIAAHPRFRVTDLPGPLGDDSKLVLVRRLIREGLLRVDGSGDEERLASDG